MEKHTIKINNIILEYTIFFKNIKNLYIEIDSTLNIVIKSPYKISKEKIEKFILLKINWIREKLSNYKKINSKETTFSNGETHLIFGRHYRLKFIKEMKFEITSNQILINKKQNNLLLEEHKFKLLHKFIELNISKYSELLDISTPIFKIKKYKNKWGLCDKNNNIYFNKKCIELSKLKIKYIIAHELCHIIYKNHNKNFYKLLESIFPNFEKIEDKIDFVKI
jgi:predicted metal-dependent hydrolase